MPYFANIVDIDIKLGSKNITNKHLEEIVDTNSEWIIERTGIESRPVCSESEDVYTLSLEACKNLMARHDIKIDGIIAATTTATDVFPNLSNKLAAALNIQGFSFDISAACSGYIYALNIAQSMMNTQEEVKNILIISSDTLTKCVDWSDRNTCILFGDAGTATLVQSQKYDKSPLSSFIHSCHDDDRNLSLKNGSINKNHGYIEMNGKVVFRNAVAQMSHNMGAILDREGLTTDDIDIIIPHQANQRILDAVAQKLNVNPDKVFSCMKNLGNTSAASIPLALKQLSLTHTFSDNSKVLMSAFGAGFTSGALLWNLNKNQRLFEIS